MTLGEREAVLLLARVPDNNNGRGGHNRPGDNDRPCYVRLSICPSLHTRVGQYSTEPILLTVLRLAELA